MAAPTDRPQTLTPVEERRSRSLDGRCIRNADDESPITVGAVRGGWRMKMSQAACVWKEDVLVVDQEKMHGGHLKG